MLIHIDTELAAKDLLNNRMAYVAVSRGAHDAQIFTSDREKLPTALSRDVSKQRAHTPEVKPEAVVQQQAVVQPREEVYTAAKQERHQAPMREALEPEDAAQFRWKGETRAIQTYQHKETGLNIHIDSKGGFYSQDGKPTSQDAALDRAMPVGRAHSQNEYENSPDWEDKADSQRTASELIDTPNAAGALELSLSASAIMHLFPTGETFALS